MVGPNITDSKAWMISKNKDLSEVPKSGWQYHDTKWSEDKTLEFQYKSLCCGLSYVVFYNGE